MQRIHRPRRPSRSLGAFADQGGVLVVSVVGRQREGPRVPCAGCRAVLDRSAWGRLRKRLGGGGRRQEEGSVFGPTVCGPSGNEEEEERGRRRTDDETRRIEEEE